ncbi:sugar ABC transporter substrate-binding protein [Micromonospora craterilacus]|uniref:Sugar ABC transporter substrate-binding protein n=1 Tax=Micromonospora craterilacus TaxID=1655439 RepID=A0A2W2EMB3_9ACTN|nr:ABC transporter substrate-binding protein [Micromonospora craterilacus]PZG23851.1 sugar ABC transporter substrate-binding protein [Micromonospora craterilacus]
MTRRLVALAATAVVLVTAGCGGDADPGSDPARSDLSGKTVEVAAAWSGTEQENFQAVLDAFAAKTGATVKYTTGGNDLAVLLNSRIAGGSPPDVALIPQPGVVSEFVKRGAVKPLTGAAAEAIRANYSPAWQELGTVDGQLYGVYFKVANKSVIWYRTDSFADAGVEPPTTWEQLRAVSTALADSGVAPMVAAGGDGWVLTDWFENVYLRVGGPENYDKLARHEISWTDPTVVKSLTLLAEYWRNPRFLAGGPRGAVQTTFTQSIADVFGKSPKAAMLFEGDFVASEITKLGELTVGETAKFFNWPAIDGSKPAVVTAGDQAVAFKDTPEANALMAFLASPEAARIMAAKGGFISANSGLDTAAYPDPTTRELAEAVVNAELLRFDLSDLTPQAFGGGTSATLWVQLQDFLAGSVTPENLAQHLEDAAKREFGGN